MTVNWKKTLVVVFDIAIAAYLILAVTAFNKPADKTVVCDEVEINIGGGESQGFLTVQEIRSILERKRIYPIAMPLNRIDVRGIEETLLRNPFVESAQCYKTLAGHVVINICQRMPTIHVIAANGDSYYLDTAGNIIPESKYASDLVIATGAISRKYAQKTLPKIANYLMGDKFWQSQVEQVNVLSNGAVEIVPRVGDHIVYLGQPVRIDKKLERLRKFYTYGLNVAGWNKYKYINLEFDNQIICKKKTNKVL